MPGPIKKSAPLIFEQCISWIHFKYFTVALVLTLLQLFSVPAFSCGVLPSANEIHVQLNLGQVIGLAFADYVMPAFKDLDRFQIIL